MYNTSGNRGAFLLFCRGTRSGYLVTSVAILEFQLVEINQFVLSRKDRPYEEEEEEEKKKGRM